jgi:hypothetical protein
MLLFYHEAEQQEYILVERRPCGEKFADYLMWQRGQGNRLTIKEP